MVLLLEDKRHTVATINSQTLLGPVWRSGSQTGFDMNSGSNNQQDAGPATEEKAEQLEKILHSRSLQNSESLRALLQYVARRVIEGRDSQVKEYTIAVEVFGRSQDFNASTDSLVRVQAKRLRDKLKEYYETEGKSDRVLIDLPKGHYTAVFSYIDLQEPAAPVVSSPLEDDQAASPMARRAQLAAGDKRITAVLTGLVVVLAVVVTVLGNSNRVLRKQATQVDGDHAAPSYGPLWEPFIGSAMPAMLILSNPPVFKFVNPVDPEILARNSVELTPQQSSKLADTLPEGILSKQDSNYRLMLSAREYTGVGEAIGLYEVAELLRSAGKNPVYKQSRTVSAEDLKGHNVVLLGSVWSNVWSGKLPVKEDFSYTLNATIENNNPRDGEQHEYKPAFNESGELIKDYALVTVRPAVTSGTIAMVLAGVESEGTQAAAEFVTRKEYVEDLNRRLDQITWDASQPRYYQVLLEADVDNGIPTTISVVAIHPIKAVRKN